MDDAAFSTTGEACDPVKGCPCSCDRGWKEVQDEVNQALRSPDPLERNRQITAAYARLAAADPNNIWVRLSSYVSAQVGCNINRAMQFHYLSNMRLSAPAKIIDALQEGNRVIFSTMYPVMRFTQRCGVQTLRDCKLAEKIPVDVPDELLDGIDVLERGDPQKAAGMIASFEQKMLVQPVYERHEAIFSAVSYASGLPLDFLSIPVSKSCVRDDLVSIDGLNILDPRDRVLYFDRLVDRMQQQDGGIVE